MSGTPSNNQRRGNGRPTASNRSGRDNNRSSRDNNRSSRDNGRGRSSRSGDYRGRDGSDGADRGSQRRSFGDDERDERRPVRKRSGFRHDSHGSGSTPQGPKGRKRIPSPPGNGSSRGEASEWEERDEVRVERVVDQPKAKARSASGGGRRRTRAKVDVSDVDMGNLAPATAVKLQRRLGEAADAYAAERFTEAEQLLASINRIAPNVAEVHELAGLTQYRLGRWKRALKELERFTELTGSAEQHPVMADCYRAEGLWDDAERLWFELGDASPGPELVEEGRIVQAGSLADQGRLQDAIRFLDRAPKPKGKPKLYHLRRWYALADLYERAGDNARARRLFTTIAQTDADFGDAAERAANLA